jgi:hypothetical protein
MVRRPRHFIGRGSVGSATGQPMSRVAIHERDVASHRSMEPSSLFGEHLCIFGERVCVLARSDACR